MNVVGIELIRSALITALILAAPILMSGLVIGLCVSIFQTVTQIQEQTLSFVPKIAGMIIVAVLLVPWILNKLSQYAILMFTGVS